MYLLLAAALIAIPLGLDLYMPVPDDNPITTERLEQGRKLFFDTRLSRDRMISCSSCHDPQRAFTDGRPVAIGVFNRVGRRSAPALVNRGYGRAFFWDGRATTLEEQVLKPIEDADEMDLTIAEASARVGLPAEDISRSLASFVRSLLSGGSPFDRYIDGARDALTAEQQAGLHIFRGKANCTACHVGPTFSDESFHNTGVAWRNGALLDEGRFAVTGNTPDHGAFKTPTLREVARTAPYMHDGSIATLDEVIEFYDRGANVNPWLDADIRPLKLTSVEKQSLVAFLQSLDSPRNANR
jgi:cytochrome c peroxidase